MKLKLTQAGYENMTGLFGYIEFENGASVRDVQVADGARLATILSCEWEDGTNPSVEQSYEDRKGEGAAVVPELPRGTDETATQPEPPLNPEPEATTKIYTKAELEVIADSSGIKGLREIADAHGVTANSIVGLIDKLIEGGYAKAE